MIFAFYKDKFDRRKGEGTMGGKEPTIDDEIGWERLNPVVSYANRLECPPGYAFGPRIVHDRQFIWVAEGSGKANIQGREYEATGGDLFHYGPGIVHRFEADSARPFVLYGLHFQLHGDIPAAGAVAYRPPAEKAPDWPEADVLPNRLTIGQPPNVLSVPEHIRCLGRELETLFHAIAHNFQHVDPMHHTFNRGLMVQLLMELRAIVRRQSEIGSENGLRMRDVRGRLKANAAMPYEREWLREWTHYHENHASALFRLQYGQSPHDYFMSCKLGLAKKMLIASELAVGEISEALAFSSLHYFSRLFKQRTGYSPLAYRRNGRQI